MSADNLVYALPFKKMTGAVVWRVGEVFLSGLGWDLCHMMSVQSRSKRFQEFSGPDAARQAHAAAVQLARRLPVCEYGVTALDESHEPLTMRQLQQRAIEDGYREDDVWQLREATDDDFANKEIEYWAN